MGMRARRPRRRRWAPAYLRTAAWQAKRLAIWERAKGMCEFCGRRPMRHVHHRTYAAFGREPLRDLLAVCAGCHRYIHKRGPRGTCTAGSLMAHGDPGTGMPTIWLRYLAMRGAQRPEVVSTPHPRPPLIRRSR
jgi:5-methylcytosine-specific restriction endonuclease McrA